MDCRHHGLETLAKGSEVVVYQCGHGLLHLRVNGVTLTLKPDEFHQLAILVCDAHIRLATREVVREVDGMDAGSPRGRSRPINAR